jgi:hypothetical protein
MQIMKNSKNNYAKQAQIKFNSRLIQDFKSGHTVKWMFFNLFFIMENYEIFTSHKELYVT